MFRNCISKPLAISLAAIALLSNGFVLASAGDQPTRSEMEAVEEQLLRLGGATGNERVMLAKKLHALRPELSESLERILKLLDDDTSFVCGTFLGPPAGPTDENALRRAIISLRSPDASERAHAAMLLSGSGDSGTNSVTMLVSLLGDPEREVRASAEFALSFIGASNPVPILDAIDDRKPHVRAAAIRVLGEFPELSEQSIPIVLPLLSDKDHEVAKTAINTLGELQSRDAIPALALLANHPATRTRTSALRALSRIGRLALPSLRSVLPSLWHNQTQVRLEAERAIVALIRSDED